MTRGAFNTMMSKPQNQEIVRLIRGENDCNVRKAKGRAGYIYTKPVTEWDKKKRRTRRRNCRLRAADFGFYQRYVTNF